MNRITVMRSLSKRNRNRLLLSAIGLLLGLTSSFAGTDFYAFLEEPVASAVTGMGASGTASGMGGFTFYNPAGLSLRDKSFITFDFTRLANDLGRGYIESGWVFPTWFIGGTFQTQSINVQRTDITGILDGAFAPTRGTMLSLLTGIKRERYSLAIALNGVQEVIGDYSSYGASGSIGLLINIVPEHITAGVTAIHGAGRHTSFLDGKEKLKSERFPATIRAGACLKDSLLHKFPIIVSADVVYNDNDELVTIPIGIDFRILPPLTIRLGKRFNHPSDLFALGLGLQWKNIAFDASVTPYVLGPDLFVKRSAGVTYSLPSRRVVKTEGKDAKKDFEPAKTIDTTIQVIPQETAPEVPKDTAIQIQDTVINQPQIEQPTRDSLSSKSITDTNEITAVDSTARNISKGIDSIVPVPANIETKGISNTVNDSTIVAPVTSETKETIAPASAVEKKVVQDTIVTPVPKDTVQAGPIKKVK
jgi:hypothetical protein